MSNRLKIQKENNAMCGDGNVITLFYTHMRSLITSSLTKMPFLLSFR